LSGQKIPEHRHVVTTHVGEQQCRPTVEPLHDAGYFEMRIDRRGVGLEPPALAHPLERRAEVGIDRCDARGERRRHVTLVNAERASTVRPEPASTRSTRSVARVPSQVR